VKRQRHVVGRCVDGNVWRPITELRVGAASMRSAELQPVVTTLRFARWRRQLHVEYVENDLGVGATGRQETVAVGVGRVQRRVIHRADVADARLSRPSAPRPSASVQTADVDALLVVCSKQKCRTAILHPPRASMSRPTERESVSLC